MKPPQVRSVQTAQSIDAENKCLKRITEVGAGSKEPARQDGPRPLDPEERAALMERLQQSICSLSGLETKEVAMQVTAVLGNLQFWNPPKTANEGLLIAMALLAEFRPQTLAESLLAVQMVAVFQASTKLLASGVTGAQSLEHAEWKTRTATRLMRLYTEQLEMMIRLKGKSTQQKVIVEHVHVHSGGQAIVGAVRTQTRPKKQVGGGGETKI
jgi:hypothetical protein